MLEIYILIVVAVMAVVLLAKNKGLVHSAMISFFVLQGAGVAYTAIFKYNQNAWGFFDFDALGLTYAGLMSVVGLLTVWRSIDALEAKTLRERKIYFLALLALSVSLIGVYLSNNIAVNWIFLEATTLATAVLSYHHRTVRSLEATWKYVFVCSIGIAVAYLGVLLLSTTPTHTLGYDELMVAVGSTTANPIYLKLAFLFILIGYSTKLEVFPLFTVGIDVNHSAPAPASAFISSALVGGGYVAIFRVYKVMMASSVSDWVLNLLTVVVVVSLISSAVYMGRTGNFKRMLAYSTVENSGLTLLGLALGGVGVFASVLHSLAHTVIKAVSFLQLSKVGRLYGTYKIGPVSGYIKNDRLGALVLLLCVVSLVAAPPSLLFRSEFMMFSEVLHSSRWWLIILIVIPLLTCAYWSLTKLLTIIFSPVHGEKIERQKPTAFSYTLLALLLGLFVLCVTNVELVNNLIREIINF